VHYLAKGCAALTRTRAAVTHTAAACTTPAARVRAGLARGARDVRVVQGAAGGVHMNASDDADMNACDNARMNALGDDAHMNVYQDTRIHTYDNARMDSWNVVSQSCVYDAHGAFSRGIEGTDAAPPASVRVLKVMGFRLFGVLGFWV